MESELNCIELPPVYHVKCLAPLTTGLKSRTWRSKSSSVCQCDWDFSLCVPWTVSLMILGVGHFPLSMQLMPLRPLLLQSMSDITWVERSLMLPQIGIQPLDEELPSPTSAVNKLYLFWGS